MTIRKEAPVRLSFVYFVERPYGRIAETEKGKKFRQKQLAFAKKIFQLLDRNNIPRTIFIIGDYLKRCLEKFSPEHLRKIYNPDNPLNDLQSHTYSHLFLVKPLEVESRPLISPDKFKEDIKKANKVFWQILKIKPKGLSLPLGYPTDMADVPSFLRVLQGMEFLFVCSHTRSKKEPLFAPLTLERQPHVYNDFPGLVEIPTHGWQDVIFTREKSKQFLQREPDKKEKILEHFRKLLLKAQSLSRLSQQGQPIYVGLPLHIWAVMEYDKELEIHTAVIKMARKLKMKIMSFSHVAEEILNR